MDNTSIKDEITTNVPVEEYEYCGLVRGIFIFMLLSSGINCISKFIINLTWGNTVLGTIMFLCEVANIFFVIKILNKKAWGVFAFFGMLLLQIPMNLLLDSSDMEAVYVSTFVRLIIFSLILLIPNKGITGWRVLFGNKGDLLKNLDENCLPDLGLSDNKRESLQEDNEELEVITSQVPETGVNATVDESRQDKTIVLPEGCELEPLSTERQESAITTESESTPDVEPECMKSVSCSVQERKRIGVLTVPIWSVIVGCTLLLVLITTLVVTFVSNGLNRKQEADAVDKKSPSTAVFQHLDYVEDEYIISEAELKRNRDNVAKIYSILKEEGYTDLGNNVDEFASMMSMISNRKIAFELMNKEYDMGTFESFDAHFYPATEEHLNKEKDRRWFYKELKDNGLVVGSYETFCALLCYDEDLQNFYKQGLKAGLDLGTYEEYVQYIR